MEPESPAPEPRPAVDTRAVLELMFRIGQAYLACGEQTAQVELYLRRISSAYRMRRARVVAFPTAIFISLHDEADEHVTLAEGPTQILRLDQIADIYELGDEIRSGALPPRAALKRLAEILRKSARFGVFGVVGGHTVLTIGLAIVLMPTLSNLTAAAILGSIVGAVKAFNRNRPILAAPLAVVAAGIVSALVFLALKVNLPVDPLDALVPPLVTFLPGAMLTFGMVELAYGDMVSGSSRLITGFVQLILLAFGLALGAALVGYRPENLLDSGIESVAEAPAAWLSWVGVIVFGIGVYLHHSAPRNSLCWMLLVLVATFAAQQCAALAFGPEISGFFGTLVATPLGYLIQLQFRGPPSMVTFLPSFWLLVPGSLGLLSVARMLSDRAAGLDGLVTAVFAFASIALGTLVGASLYKGLTETFGWWGLKIGRTGRYFRRRKG
ncbi:MAG: threonine/serine exporter family protein [Planctomycetota bacterium]